MALTGATLLVSRTTRRSDKALVVDQAKVGNTHTVELSRTSQAAEHDGQRPETASKTKVRQRPVKK